MGQPKAVEYLDQNGKTRWGYICPQAWEKVKKFLREKEGGEERISVYLPDGTTGDVALSDLRLIEPFVETSPLPSLLPPREGLLLEEEI